MAAEHLLRPEPPARCSWGAAGGGLTAPRGVSFGAEITANAEQTFPLDPHVRKSYEIHTRAHGVQSPPQRRDSGRLRVLFEVPSKGGPLKGLRFLSLVIN